MSRGRTPSAPKPGSTSRTEQWWVAESVGGEVKPRSLGATLGPHPAKTGDRRTDRYQGLSTQAADHPGWRDFEAPEPRRQPASLGGNRRALARSTEGTQGR